jgi:hypothetical protein
MKNYKLEKLKQKLLKSASTKERSAIYYFIRLLYQTNKDLDFITLSDIIQIHKRQKYKNNSPYTLFFNYFPNIEKIPNTRFFPKTLEDEIARYKAFITDPIKTYKHPQMLQRENTFNNFTLQNIKYFCEYLIKMDYDLFELDTLAYVLQDELVDYYKYLYKKYKTQTAYIRIRTFINMLKYFYQIDTANIEDELKQLKKLPYQPGRQSLKIYEYEIINFQELLKAIQQINDTKERLIMELLSRTCWRTRNIINLQLQKNLIKEAGIYRFQFSPDEQKRPRKLNNVEQWIIGILPYQITKYLDNYINDYGIKDKLFTGYSLGYLNTFVKNVCGKMSFNILSPHSFRSIITQNYVDETGNILNAEIILWHKLPISTTTQHYLKPNFTKALKELNLFIDSSIQ